MKKRTCFLKDGNRVIFFNPDEIIYGESDGNYQIIHFMNARKGRFYGTMDNFLNHVKILNFFYRVNRSFFVNLNEVMELTGKTKEVEMSNGDKVSITQTEIAAFEAAMNATEIKKP